MSKHQTRHEEERRGMSLRPIILGYIGLVGLTATLWILNSIQGLLPGLATKALWALIVGSVLGTLYGVYWLYNRFHALYHVMATRRYGLKASQQALQIEQERWQIERASLLMAQHHASTRIYADGKGFMPTIVSIDEAAGYQYVQLPHPVHQARIAQSNQQPAISEHKESTGIIPESVRYEEIAPQVPRGRSCLGVSENGVEHCDFAQLMTMWICGGSSTGKSNTVALKIDEAIRNGRKIQIILVDPHARKDDSLYNKIRCYEQHFLFQVATSEEDIFNALSWFKGEFERRLEAGGKGQSDILLVVDEVSNVVDSDDQEIGKLIKKIAKICGQESRGFGMFGWFISQDAAGLAWLRKRAMTVIAHKLNMMSERKLACNEDMEIARDMDSWPRGRVAVYGLNFTSVMVAQMPAFSPPIVEGTIVDEADLDDDMEALQPRRDWQDSDSYSDTFSADSDAQKSDERKVLVFQKNGSYEPVERSDLGTEEGRKPAKEYRFTEIEIVQFIAAYKMAGNIEKVLSSMKKGSGYKAHAREIIATFSLRKDA